MWKRVYAFYNVVEFWRRIAHVQRTMAIYNLFSKRLKQATKTSPDVYQYSEVPQALRIQILRIIEDVHTRDAFAYGYEIYSKVYDILTREYGAPSLGNGRDNVSKINSFFQTCDTSQALDLIECAFSMIDGPVRTEQGIFQNAKQSPDQAISELNGRFREHCFGFEFVSGQLIRIDSNFTHSQAVKPALVLLKNPKFSAAESEFLSAFTHYREGRNESALNEALKAFESTMKIICSVKGWSYNQNDTAKTLIDVLFKNKLVPDFLQAEFAAIRTVLEAGVPTARNKLSGHGKGVAKFELPPWMVAYALHMTASNIVMLGEAAGIK